MATQTCTRCQVGMMGLDHVSSEFVRDVLTGQPILDLILSCPACDQKYNAFLALDAFTPLNLPEGND